MVLAPTDSHRFTSTTLAGYGPGSEASWRVVNVARDGGVQAIVLDTVAAARARRCGVGTS